MSYHEGHVWKVLVVLGWSPQRPEGRARERKEEQIQDWKKKVWPAIKKKSAPREAHPVFIDESGLSQRSHRCRTWAPRGLSASSHSHCSAIEPCPDFEALILSSDTVLGLILPRPLR